MVDVLSSTEPDLIQRQRDIVRAYREAGQQRAGAEAQADEEYTQEQSASEKALNDDRAAAKLLHNKVVRIVGFGTADWESKLAWVGLEHLSKQITVSPTNEPPGADAEQMVSRCLPEVQEAYRGLTAGVLDLQNWREARRGRILNIIIVTILLVIVAGGVAWWYIASHNGNAHGAPAPATTQVYYRTAAVNRQPLLESDSPRRIQISNSGLIVMHPSNAHSGSQYNAIRV